MTCPPVADDLACTHIDYPFAPVLVGPPRQAVARQIELVGLSPESLLSIARLMRRLNHHAVCSLI